MSDQTFHQIAAEQGEEAAIRAGIAADPDTMELDERVVLEGSTRPEAAPHVVEASCAVRALLATNAKRSRACPSHESVTLMCSHRR